MQFGPELRQQLEENLGRHERLAVPLDERRHAAVAVVVVDSDPELHGVDDHPAATDDLAAIPGAEDLALAAASRAPRAARPCCSPGAPRPCGRTPASGRCPAGGSTTARTRSPPPGASCSRSWACTSTRRALLGALDDYPTRSGYVITPFVFWGGANPELHPHPDEVASVHRIAFRELCRPDSPRFVSIPESERPVVQIPIGGDLIHAPTGAVLLQFRRVAIEGTTERVAGYEQPVFAWR